MESVYDKKDMCCGCTACFNICPAKAITMVSDSEGFLYPQIDQGKCIDCVLCKQVCAFQKGYNTPENLSQPAVYAVKHKLDIVRGNSTSGGIFTAVSDFVLNNTGVVYGAAFTVNHKVIHIRADNVQDRNACRGSKYVQSELTDTYRRIKSDLSFEKLVFFTGTPCQVAGLNSFLDKSHICKDNLLTADLVCHGTPSPKVFGDYLKFLEKKSCKTLAAYKFRSKVTGWNHTEEAVFIDGSSEYNTPRTLVHKKLFYANLCLRPSCHQCRYTNTNRTGDVTMADFWGIEDHFPKFKDKLGVSAFIVNTKKGMQVAYEVRDDIEIISSTMADCAVRQANLHTPSKMNIHRFEFWKDYQARGFDYISKKYGGYGIKNSIKKGIISGLKKSGLLKYVKAVRRFVRRQLV